MGVSCPRDLGNIASSPATASSFTPPPQGTFGDLRILGIPGVKSLAASIRLLEGTNGSTHHRHKRCSAGIASARPQLVAQPLQENLPDDQQFTPLHDPGARRMIPPRARTPTVTDDLILSFPDGTSYRQRSSPLACMAWRSSNGRCGCGRPVSAVGPIHMGPDLLQRFLCSQHTHHVPRDVNAYRSVKAHAVEDQVLGG